MMIPSAVSDERRTFRRISRNARTMALNSISDGSSRAFVALDVAVAKPDRARRVGRHFGLVRHHQDRDAALAVESARAVHDLDAPGACRDSRSARRRRAPTARRRSRARWRRAASARPRAPPACAIPSPVRPTAASASRARACRSRCGHAAIDQWKLDVLECGRAIEQIESLKHEAEIVAAQQRALLAGERSDVDALEAVCAIGWQVEAPEDVHGRRLARAARTHHRDELASCTWRSTPASACTSACPLP